MKVSAFRNQEDCLPIKAVASVSPDETAAQGRGKVFVCPSGRIRTFTRRQNRRKRRSFKPALTQLERQRPGVLFGTTLDGPTGRHGGGRPEPERCDHQPARQERRATSPSP
jgi:hypothetical protein